jgi:hypothetical protein
MEVNSKYRLDIYELCIMATICITAEKQTSAPWRTYRDNSNIRPSPLGLKVEEECFQLPGPDQLADSEWLPQIFAAKDSSIPPTTRRVAQPTKRTSSFLLRTTAVYDGATKEMIMILWCTVNVFRSHTVVSNGWLLTNSTTFSLFFLVTRRHWYGPVHLHQQLFYGDLMLLQ